MADDKTFTQAEVDALVAERLATETEGLKKNRDEVMREAKAAKAALKNFDGVDPDEFKKMKESAEAAERKRLAGEGDFKSLEKQLIEKHAAELGMSQKQVEKYRAAVERRLVQAELTAAITRHRGDPDLLLPHASRHVRVREAGDDFEAYVVDAAGNPRIADGKGTPMTFDDLVTQDLLVKYPRAFDGTGSSGGGATKSSGSAGGVRSIAAGDDKAFLANLDDIASGKVVVR